MRQWLLANNSYSSTLLARREQNKLISKIVMTSEPEELHKYINHEIQDIRHAVITNLVLTKSDLIYMFRTEQTLINIEQLTERDRKTPFLSTEDLVALYMDMIPYTELWITKNTYRSTAKIVLNNIAEHLNTPYEIAEEIACKHHSMAGFLKREDVTIASIEKVYDALQRDLKTPEHTSYAKKYLTKIWNNTAWLAYKAGQLGVDPSLPKEWLQELLTP